MKGLRYFWRVFNCHRRVNREEIAFLASQVRSGDAAVGIGAHKGGFL